MGRVLIIAYHFPPCAGSSGLLRSEKLVRYLPEFGWDPVVLTAHPRAYETIEPGSENKTKSPVLRAFALDTRKHLSLRGSYFGWMALPDRWIAWLLGAVPMGLRAIRKYRTHVIFSTFPISTAILIGLVLNRLTGVPWIVDLRDSMTEKEYPKDVRERKARRWIEKQAVQRAYYLLFTAKSTRQMYLERYPSLSPDKCILIPNGYDEDDFSSLAPCQTAHATPARRIRLLHTGLIYPEERDPLPFFRALARLKQERKISSADLRISLRASGSVVLFQSAINELDISDIVELLPHIPYRQSLEDCANSDGLLLFQAANCDHQIPAKAYEYLRVGKAIFALTTQSGDTAALLNEVGGATIVNLADEQDIYRQFPVFLAALRSGTHPLPRRKSISRYARRNQTAELAKLLAEAGKVKLVAEGKRTVNLAEATDR